MNVSYKRSVLTSIIFGFLYLFIIVFFRLVGPDEFNNSKDFQFISAVVIGVAMFLFAIMIIITNKKSNIVDERDYAIQKQAASIGLMVSLIYVFLLSITLFITNRDSSVISISWLWFIAYSTFAFGYFSTSLVNVVLYSREQD